MANQNTINKAGRTMGKLRHTTSLTNIEIRSEDEVEEEKKEKQSRVTLFNKFDTIEESVTYEEQCFEETELPIKNVGIKTPIPNKVNSKPFYKPQQSSRKTNLQVKTGQAGTIKDKIKHDIS